MEAMIRQGATPALDIVLHDVAVQDATVYVTIDQGDKQLTKSNYSNDPSVICTAITSNGEQTGTNIQVLFNQAETLRLRPGFGHVQVRWIFEDGSADSSDIGRIEIAKSFLKAVIAHG